jgi:glycolate oxidase iron-sulfur subunit
MTTLRVDPEELVTCVSCGLCLPHCPTYRVTGDESASPRGRIAAMRAVQAGVADLDGEFTRYMDECVQCRACEAVCPSAVAFGHLMEGARETLAAETAYVPRWQRLGYGLLTHHRLLVAGSRALAVAQRLRLVPSRLSLPPLPLRAAPLRPTGDDVWLFTGCVMDAWQRPTHAAVLRVLGAAGVGVALPDARLAGCCGALHTHAGLIDQARALARRVIEGFPGEAPILVDSAGCGAALKGYAHLLGTDEARRFVARVHDVHEWLAARPDRLPAPLRPRAFGAVVAVHDPCHLRHVQRVAGAVRTVLAPYADLRELDDDGLCCGAGGAYAALHPELASEIRARKLDAIARTDATVVASANPGCTLHLAAAGVDTRHPLEIVDAALRGPDRRRHRRLGGATPARRST